MSDEPKRKRGNPNWAKGGKDHRPAFGNTGDVPGWGGPAKGPGMVITADNQPERPPPEVIEARKAAKLSAAELARPHAPDAIALYVAVLNDPKEGSFNRMAAADKLLARGYGNTTQTVVVETESLTPDERAARIAALQAKLAET